MHPELRGAAGGHPRVGGISDDPRKNGFGNATRVFFSFRCSSLGNSLFGLQVQAGYTEREQMDAGCLVENGGKINFFFFFWYGPLKINQGQRHSGSSGKTTLESRLQAWGLCFCVLSKVTHGNSRLRSGELPLPRFGSEGR